MRGLFFAVFFCAVSLLFAETLATILVDFSFIQPHEFDEAHGLIMLILLALYMGYAPTFPKDFKHHHDDHNHGSGDSGEKKP
jgi:hypothetical protein